MLQSLAYHLECWLLNHSDEVQVKAAHKEGWSLRDLNEFIDGKQKSDPLRCSGLEDWTDDDRSIDDIQRWNSAKLAYVARLTVNVVVAQDENLVLVMSNNKQQLHLTLWLREFGITREWLSKRDSLRRSVRLRQSFNSASEKS
jgi:hypothetical protein